LSQRLSQACLSISSDTPQLRVCRLCRECRVCRVCLVCRVCRVGAADAVPGVPDGLLGVHGVVCFSVPVPAQDIGAMLWIPIAATRPPLCFLRSGPSMHGVCMVCLVCLVCLVVPSVPSQATRLSILTVCTHCSSSKFASTTQQRTLFVRLSAK